jgi:L-serine deaminase
MVVSLGGTCSACGAGACGIFPMVNQVNQYWNNEDSKDSNCWVQTFQIYNALDISTPEMICRYISVVPFYRIP